MRALGYVRLSNLTDQSTSPARQRAQIEAYCTSRGWTLVDVVEDLDVSGSNVGLRLGRPGLRQVRARWADADVLVVAKLDRLARNVSDFSTLVEEAGSQGTALASVSEGLDLTTPAGRFVATILAAFAEMEAATIRARIVEGRAHLREAGRFAGGVTPYGYVSAPREGGGRTLAVHEPEAAVIHSAAAAVLSGASLYGLVKQLNSDGVPTKTGKRWNTVTLHTILTGWSVTGVPSHKGTPLRDEAGEPVQAFPPVLDRATFHAVRERLSRTRTGRRARPPAQLLSGLSVCGVCGSRVYSGSARGEKVYRCSRNGQGGCGLGGVRVRLADPVVEGKVLDRYGSYPVVAVERVDLDTDVELAEVEAAIAETTDAMRGDADLDEAMAQLSRLRAKRAQLRAAPGSREVERFTGRSLAGHWREAGTQERARLLAAVLDQVEILPGERGGEFNPDRLVLRWSADPSLVTPFPELGEDGALGYVRLS